MVSTDIKEMNYNKLNNIEQLNNLLNSINGKKDNYFVKLKVNKKNSTKYIVERQEDFKQLFVFLKINDKNNMANINVYDIYNDNKTSELVLDTENEDIAISSVYALDINKFKKLVEERDKFDINEIDNNVITGDIEVSKDGVFILTVPYEKGWEIFIDGTKVEYYEALDYFVGFDLSKGEHEIKLYYKVPGFSFGVCCSGISLILLIVYTLRNKYQRVLGV